MKNVIFAGFIICFINGHSQPATQKMRLHTGDRFEKITTGKMVATMQRVRQLMRIETNSTLEKSFEITAAADSTYSIDARVTRVYNTMETQGKKLVFDSNQPGDNNIAPYNSVAASVNKTLRYGIYNDGVIYRVDSSEITGNSLTRVKNADTAHRMKAQLANYTPADLQLATGATFELAAYFNFRELKNNSTWTDSSVSTDGKSVITYKVSGITDSLVTVTFNGTTVKTDSSNASDLHEKSQMTGTIKGEIKIDASSGVIVHKAYETDMHGTTQILGFRLNVGMQNTVTETVTKVK
jgi:hypothetical protein